MPPPQPPSPSPTRPSDGTPAPEPTSEVDALVAPRDATGERSDDLESPATLGGGAVNAAVQELVVIEGPREEARGAAVEGGDQREASGEGEEADVAEFLRSSLEADRLAQVRLCLVLVLSCPSVVVC